MIPRNHPRAESLHTREKLVRGFRDGLVVAEGLIAHGRGEAYDYLMGEHTSHAAKVAVKAAAAILLLSKNPVLSVNGNAVALCPREIVKLSNILGAKIEVNLFYRTEERETAIRAELETHGATGILGVGPRVSAKIPELSSERRHVDQDGIYIADTVFVPLEDGDRTEALVKMGKNVIAVDLNPLSRTAESAQVTIVDNLVRAMPALIEQTQKLKDKDRKVLENIATDFDSEKNLAQSLAIIRGSGKGRRQERS